MNRWGQLAAAFRSLFPAVLAALTAIATITGAPTRERGVLGREDVVGLRWHAPSGRVLAADVARQRPEVAVHLSAFGATEVSTASYQQAKALAADARLDTTPPRATVGLALMRNGWAYDCRECHTLLVARWRHDRDQPLNEHRDIALDHGNNRFCLNCHHATTRNAWADYDGTEIAEADVVSLCAKCHGTIFRDWQAGVHGRSSGHWRPDMGLATKLRCIQCHDPHRPAFAAMKPLAPLRYPPRAAHSPIPLRH